MFEILPTITFYDVVVDALTFGYEISVLGSPRRIWSESRVCIINADIYQSPPTRENAEIFQGPNWMTV